MSESKSEFVDVKYPHNKFEQSVVNELTEKARSLYQAGKRASSIRRELNISKHMWYAYIAKEI